MITQTQLDLVRELAGLFFTIEEISLLTMIDQEELRREISFGHSELNNAYWIGKLEAERTLRQKTSDFAKTGSPQAEQQMLEHLQRMNESEKQ